jgi:hypothetical protein
MGKMKKLLLTLMVGLILATGMVLTSGCGGFNGDVPSGYQNGGCSCNDETEVHSYLDVTIVKQPVGGQSISSLSCDYQVRYRLDEDAYVVGENWYVKDDDGKIYPMGAPSAVRLEVTWYNDRGEVHGQEFIWFGLRPQDLKNGTYTTSIAAPQGMYFDKTFKVKFTWSDDAHISGVQNVFSNDAVCTVY